MEIDIARCCVGKQTPIVSWSGSLPVRKCYQKFPHTALGFQAKMGWSRLAHSRLGTAAATDLMKQRRWRMHVMSVDMGESLPAQPEDYSAEGEEDSSTDSSEEKLLTSEDLRSLLVDPERSRLVKKLSEANQQNRFLKREIYAKEDALLNFKKELAVMELDIQALISLAEEIARSEIPKSTRKINGKFIQSILLLRLKAVREKLEEQIKDVATAKSKEVSIFWCGMAESVQVMGSFDGWSQGEHLSPEYDGSFTKFTATMMLRPGKYEIKFLVDGEWHLSPEYPTIGEGLMENNLLIVE